jgi:hypothetical protein
VTDPSKNPDPLVRLSEKLTEFQDELDPQEAALLSGLLGIAADAIGPSGDGPGHTDLVTRVNGIKSATMEQGDTPPQLGRDLLRQFTSAFTADPAPPGPTRAIIIPGPPPTPPPTPPPGAEEATPRTSAAPLIRIIP